MKICNYCGCEIPDDSIFCTECGRSLTDVSEAAEPVETAEVAETVEAAEVAGEEAQEAAEGSAETTGEEAQETAGEVIEDAEGEGETENEEADGEESEEIPAPKKKGGWTGITTVVVIAAGVIILALFAFLGYKEGWFDALKPKVKSKCTIGDYSTIEVLQSSVEVTDDMVDEYIESLLENETDDDGNVPELTDAWVAEYAPQLLGENLTSVDELNDYVYNYIYSYYLHSATYDYLEGITEVQSYDEEKEAALIDYATETLTNYASYYGTDANTLASYYGFSSAEEYATAQADDYLTSIMIIDQVIKDLKLSYEQEELDNDMLTYMTKYGYSDTYTLEQFKEINGETWVYLYENLQFKYDLAMTALEDRVSIIEDNQE